MRKFYFSVCRNCKQPYRRVAKNKVSDNLVCSQLCLTEAGELRVTNTNNVQVKHIASHRKTPPAVLAQQRKRGNRNRHKKPKFKFEGFYASAAWMQLRYQALSTYGRVCMLCKKTKGAMHVDHIKPRSKYPEFELSFDNLQVLCKECNLGKSNLDETDFRQNRVTV
jgi:5-methylcytosine-specific restriction endonuclease McrA